MSVMATGPDASHVTKPASVLSRTFQAFRYHDFRLMWSGAFTSTTGTWMQQVAQSWLVLELTGSAFYLGLVGFLSDLPILLFTLVGGVVADRIDRRKLLLGSQYTQMTTALVLTALVVADQIHIWHILVLVFIAGTGQSFGGPAYAALVPGLVKREDVPNAIALNSIQFNLARMVGPLLAGVVLAAAGVAWCFALNGLSFIAVIISLYLIRATFVPEKTTDTVMTGLRNGFAYMKTQGPLWQLSVLGFISTFCGIPLMTLLPVFAKDVFGMGASGYANLMAASGAGAITGALLYAAYSRRQSHGRAVCAIQVIFAILLCIFALSRNLILSYVVLFFAGGCLITLFATITSLVQLNVTEGMRGRVMSIFMFAFRGGMPLGNLAFGYMASQLSPTAALVAGSAMLGCTGLGVLLSSSKVKNL
jgi:predicted MFS family arabinose efflux permease